MLRSPAPIVLSASEDMKYLQRRLHNLEAQLAENQRELLLIKEAEEAYASRLRFELENRLEEESKQRHELERKLASLEDAVMDSQIQAKKESLLRIDCQLKLLELQRQREQENKERKERERPFLSPINSTINSPEVVLYSSIRRTFSLSLNENETPPFPNTTARTAEKVPHFNENSSPEIEQTPAPSSLDTDLIETGPILDEGLHHVEKVLDLNDHSSPENEPISVPFSAADQSIEGERMTLCSTSARPEASFFSPTCADESLPHEISSFYDMGDGEGGVIVDPPLKYRGTVLRLIPLVAPILRPAPYGDATPKAMKKEKVHTEEEEAEFKRKKKMKRSKQVPVMKTRKRKASLSSKKQKEAQQKQIKEIVETSTEVEQVTEVALPERDEVSAAASNMDVITGTFDALKRQEDACNVDVPEDMKQNKKRPRKQAKRREGVSVIEDAIESDDKEEPTEAKKKRLRRKKTAKCSNEVNDSSNCALPTSGEVLNGDPVPAKSFDEVAPHKKVDIFDYDLFKDTHQNKKRPRKEVKKQVIVEPKAAEKKDNIIAELSSVQSSFSRVLKLPSLESSTISSGKFIVPKLKSQVTNKAV